MFGKDRKVLAMVKRALEKKTANLGDSEKKIVCTNIVKRIAVKRALDRAKIFDPKKRKKIHEIMKSISNRTNQLIEVGKIKTIKDSAYWGIKDRFIADCIRQITEELGPKTASKFFIKHGWQTIILGIKTMPKKPQ